MYQPFSWMYHPAGLIRLPKNNATGPGEEIVKFAGARLYWSLDIDSKLTSDKDEGRPYQRGVHRERPAAVEQRGEACGQMDLPWSSCWWR